MSIDRNTIDVYDTMAEEYRARFARPEADGDLRDFLDALPKSAQVLDLGCGPGNSAAIMAAHGHRAEAWDASTEMVALAAAQPGVTARQAAFEDLDAEAVYDGIWANFSLLHAPRAEMPGLIGRIHRALVPRGVLHLGMKTGDGATRDHLGRQYTYYTVAGLEELLDEAGFSVTHRREGEAKGLAGSNEPFVILRARA